MGVISSCCQGEEKLNNSGTSIKDDDEDQGFTESFIMETPVKPSFKLPAVGAGPPSTTKLDRLGDRTRINAVVMQEINAILLQFANDPVFQQNLTRPAVQEAFDHWQGIKEDGNHRHDIKTDPGVAAVYPQLRFLENVCVRAGVRVPLALVRQGKPSLDDTYTVIL